MQLHGVHLTVETHRQGMLRNLQVHLHLLDLQIVCHFHIPTGQYNFQLDGCFDLGKFFPDKQSIGDVSRLNRAFGSRGLGRKAAVGYKPFLDARMLTGKCVLDIRCTPDARIRNLAI